VQGRATAGSRLEAMLASMKPMLLARLASLLVLAVLSCKGGGCPPSGGSTGGGSTTEDITPPPPPPPPQSSDGADDTAGGGSSPTCLQDPVEGQWRTRLQCAGELHATMSLDVTVVGIEVDQDPVPIDKVFGNGQPGDEYTDPLVMGCCAEIAQPFCSSSASQSCYLDLIETSCQSLPVRIDEKAEDQGLDGPKEALHELATWIRNNQAQCRMAFGSTEVETTEPACAADDASAYSALLAGRQWQIPGTFSGDATDIFNVVITVGQASVTGAHDNAGAAGGSLSCWSLEDNDGEPHFLEIFPSGALIESN